MEVKYLDPALLNILFRFSLDAWVDALAREHLR